MNELEQLVSMTLQDDSAIHQENDFFVEESEIDQSAGILYLIEKTSNTQVLRIFASDNLAKSCNDLSNADDEILSELRLEAMELDNYEINLYPLESLEKAQVLKEQFGNYRFVMPGQGLYKISDRDFSWRLRYTNTGFEIYMCPISGLSERDRVIGPLGDSSIALRFFEQLIPFFNSLGIETQVINSNKMVSFHSKEESSKLEAIKKLFISGEISEELELENGGARFFLEELIVLRKFWIEMSSKFETLTQNLI